MLRCVVLSASGAVMHLPAAVWESSLSRLYCVTLAVYSALVAVQALRGKTPTHHIF